MDSVASTEHSGFKAVSKPSLAASGTVSYLISTIPPAHPPVNTLFGSLKLVVRLL